MALINQTHEIEAPPSWKRSSCAKCQRPFTTHLPTESQLKMVKKLLKDPERVMEKIGTVR